MTYDLFVNGTRYTSCDLAVYVQTGPAHTWIPECVDVGQRRAIIGRYEDSDKRWSDIDRLYFLANKHPHIYQRTNPFDDRIWEWAARYPWVYVLCSECSTRADCRCGRYACSGNEADDNEYDDETVSEFDLPWLL